MCRCRSTSMPMLMSGAQPVDLVVLMFGPAAQRHRVVRLPAAKLQRLDDDQRILDGHAVKGKVGEAAWIDLLCRDCPLRAPGAGVRRVRRESRSSAGRGRVRCVVRLAAGVDDGAQGMAVQCHRHVDMTLFLELTGTHRQHLVRPIDAPCPRNDRWKRNSARSAPKSISMSHGLKRPVASMPSNGCRSACPDES